MQGLLGWGARQAYSTSAPPCDEEVRRAFQVLNVPLSSSHADVKRRYLELVKQHHPDVAAGQQRSAPGSGNEKIAEITTAYAALSKFLKAGGSAATPQSSQPGGRQPGQPVEEEWADPHYTPFYEEMWSEMRDHAASAYQKWSQREEETLKQASWKKVYPKKQQRRKKSQKPSTTSESNSAPKWPPGDKQALHHMYEDGKSFEFIANALKKTTAEVVEVFNQWKSELSGSSSRQTRKGFRRHPTQAYSYSTSPFGAHNTHGGEDEFYDDDYDDDEVIVEVDPYGWNPELHYYDEEPDYVIHNSPPGSYSSPQSSSRRRRRRKP